MSVKQVPKESWKEICHPFYLCTVNLYPLDLEDKWGIKFFKYQEYGLGSVCASVIDIDGSLLWLQAAVDETGQLRRINDDEDSVNQNRESYKIYVNILSYERDSKLVLLKLCNELNINCDQLYDFNSQLGVAKWLLTRLDDNNNEIEMYHFLEKSCAEYVREQYEKKGHKQSYFVREKGD